MPGGQGKHGRIEDISFKGTDACFTPSSDPSSPLTCSSSIFTLLDSIWPFKGSLVFGSIGPLIVSVFSSISVEASRLSMNC